MSFTKVEIRRGAYHDSIVLMQLQVSLSKLPGVLNAGVMMGVAANKEILKQNGLLTKEAEAALPDDLIISIEGESLSAATAALAEIDTLLSSRQTVVEQEYLPKSLDAAAKMLPNAAWVLISVPGRYAAAVAREALHLKKNIFLYSDNVSIEDEVALKKEALDRGLLLLGPDCGTAIINGVGFGFANNVRRGPIGLVGASGTGLQQVTSRITQLGSGITHALGTGGRDLSANVGGITACQTLDLLQRDPNTRVIVLISKPPAPQVTTALLQKARSTTKPVIFNFLGYPVSTNCKSKSNLFFCHSLDETAELAVTMASHSSDKTPATATAQIPLAKSPGYLRGLFSGGTLAHESLLILQNYLPAVYSNIALSKNHRLEDSLKSREHTILDLGEDEFTIGRPHPMLDNTLRLQRFHQEARDPQVAIILLDVVLGYGAHPDPAGELAPAIENALSLAKADERELEVVVVVVGTEEDPQDMTSQIERLQGAGAFVETSNSAACLYVGRRLQGPQAAGQITPVSPDILQNSVEVINLGLESFAASIRAQGATVVHVNWRPPAGGDEKLMSILARMKAV